MGKSKSIKEKREGRRPPKNQKQRR